MSNALHKKLNTRTVRWLDSRMLAMISFREETRYIGKEKRMRLRLIDADALIAYCDEHWIPTNVNAINAQPTIEERKRGHWKLQKDGNAICSECGFAQACAWDVDGWDNFCHHCGADMRGEIR